MIFTVPNLTLLIVRAVNNVAISSNTVHATIVGGGGPALSNVAVCPHLVNTLRVIFTKARLLCFAGNCASYARGQWVVVEITKGRSMRHALIQILAFILDSVAIVTVKSVENWASTESSARLSLHAHSCWLRLWLGVGDNWVQVTFISPHNVTQNLWSFVNRVELGRRVV